MSVARAVKKCSEVYGFNYEESMKMFDKKEMPLPYSGEVKGNCCNLCKSGGLYTQCSSLKKEESDYCSECDSKIAKCGVEYGTISMRKECGVMSFKDVKGKLPIHYTKVMKKNNLSKEMVLEECRRLNVEILEEHFEEPVSKRGRPSSKKEDVKEKKAKGRPSKSKKVVELENETIDLFANLIKNATLSKVEVKEQAKVEEKVEEKVEAKVEVKEQAKVEAKEQVKVEAKEQVKVEVKTKALAKSDKEQEKIQKDQASALAKAEKEQAKAEKEQAKAEKEQAAVQAKAEKEQATALAKAKAKAEKEHAKEQSALAKAEKDNAKEQASALAKADKEHAKEHAKEQAKEQSALAKVEKDKAKALAKTQVKQPVIEEKVEYLAPPFQKVEEELKEEEYLEEENLAPPFEKVEEDSVEDFEYAGKKYLRSVINNTVYNMDEDEIGVWNDKTKCIELTSESESEEEEDE
jgi:hypothetical protein